MKKVVSIVLAFILVWVCVFSAAATETMEEVTEVKVAEEMRDVTGTDTQIGENLGYDRNGDGVIDIQPSGWHGALASLIYDPYIVGDANNDGSVSLADYTMVKNYVATGEGRDSIDHQADINFDGEYDAFDLFMIDKWITLRAQTTYNN